MAIGTVSVAPVGTGTPSLSKYVARAIKVLDAQTSVTHQLTPMGTVLEGDLDQVLAVIRQMHESLFDGEVQRVVTTITIDDRRDKSASMDDKVSSVKSKL
ncbi:MAG: MTH1187 family thiamine-binding protein [Chloroflexota bacterium]|nr:MTH1187 family thiamine-binding protein [Chloroflexota bacterium]